MKIFLGTFILVCIIYTASAQNLNGVVANKDNQPLKGATITISTKNLKKKAQTGEKGDFSFHNLTENASYKISVEFVGLKTFDSSFQLQQNTTLNIVLDESTAYLEPLEVRFVRASD